MRARRQLLPVLALLAAGCAGQAVSPAPGPRAQLLAVLQAEEGSIVPAELAAIVPETQLPAELAAIAADDSAPPLARNRALAAIGRFPSVAGRVVLERMARSGASPYARRLAARALDR